MGWQVVGQLQLVERLVRVLPGCCEKLPLALLLLPLVRALVLLPLALVLRMRPLAVCVVLAGCGLAARLQFPRTGPL